MKKNFMKTAVAAVCVVAAGMGGLKAYNVSEQSKADILLAQNVEALSQSDFVFMLDLLEQALLKTEVGSSIAAGIQQTINYDTPEQRTGFCEQYEFICYSSQSGKAPDVAHATGSYVYCVMTAPYTSCSSWPCAYGIDSWEYGSQYY